MTGGSKTVAARRIIRKLMGLHDPLVIFDPHGDHLGLFEKRKLLLNSCIRILFSVIRVRKNNVGIIADLIDKIGRKLTEAQPPTAWHLPG
jgi:DNA helicase HerA-like ATPase